MKTGDSLRGDARRLSVVDRAAVALSALCAVHCLATSLFIGTLAVVGGALASPLVHELGLALAVVLGFVALGLGVREHGLKTPIIIGAAGLSLMALALTRPHGPQETALTLAGVVILGIAHMLNRRILPDRAPARR